MPRNVRQYARLRVLDIRFAPYSTRLSSIFFAKKCSASRKTHDSSSLATMACASVLLLPSAITIDAASTTFVIITDNVSFKELRAYVPCGDARSKATSFFINSPLLTTQSSAFFRQPGTPCTYSGLQISTPSHSRKTARKRCTASISSPRSGLKCGKSPRQL